MPISQIKGQYHCHILTGKLKVVKGNKLRKMFSKSPRYSKSQKILI